MSLICQFSSVRMVNCRRFRDMKAGFVSCKTKLSVRNLNYCLLWMLVTSSLTVHGLKKAKANFSTFLLRWVSGVIFSC